MRLSFVIPLLLTFQVSCKQWTCTVEASGSSLIDDAPAIVAAFAECNLHKGKVILTNTTYYINTVMEITGLKSVDLDILGTMVVSLTLKWRTISVTKSQSVVNKYNLLARCFS